MNVKEKRAALDAVIESLAAASPEAKDALLEEEERQTEKDKIETTPLQNADSTPVGKRISFDEAIALAEAAEATQK